MLAIHLLQFAYGEKTILDKLSFSIKKGEIVALIGISGSGKTTLFRLITGLIQPTEGTISLDGEATYMRQEDLLLPWRTVLENLLLFTELGKKLPQKKEVIRAQALALLERVGLEGTAEAYPHTLSGGMRQRVALARSLLQNHPLMLLDEPFASLDVIIREQLYALMREIRDQYSKTIVMVTHDFRDAMALADRILVLSEGKIAADYPVLPEMRQDPVAGSQLIQSIREQLLAAV
ncbi:MAG: Aliphatic sulfonates import ATP-binding protein SsuB [Chlamydiales bacterium]|nr:Aliphatic sulfonates import ATP-binding protein SsuB [Chlamydiales bacterium]